MMTLAGPSGLVDIDYNAQRHDNHHSNEWRENHRLLVLRSLANSIEGGTSEINRNIIGERVLGLPGDIRVDKDRPWRDVPRN